MVSKSNVQFFAIALMTAGVGIAYWGYQISGGFSSQLNHAFSGSSSDDVMVRYIGGTASFVVGLFLLIKK